MAFANREEYERWKAAKAAGLSPPLPSGAAGPDAGPGAGPGAQPPAATAAPAAPGRKGFAAAFEGLPRWSWAFCGACLAIPVVTLGGAIPAAIGAGGASVCASVAKKPELSVAARAGICAVVTAVAWGLLLALITAYGAARS
jgi:hypothetical protein